ncbi:MAG: MFS transporter, partial [Pseudomonadota bacterium]
MLPSLAAANFAVGIGGFVTVGVLTPMGEAFGISAAEAGLVMTIYAVAYAIGSPLAVAATGGIARKNVLSLGLTLFGLGSAATALAPTIEVLWIARIITAVGAGLITPVAAGVAAASSTDETRGKAMASVFLGITLAQVVGVPSGAWLGY